MIDLISHLESKSYTQNLYKPIHIIISLFFLINCQSFLFLHLFLTTEQQPQPEPPMEMVQGPILIVYSNDISLKQENQFIQALILTNIFPLLNRNNAADDRQIFLDKYNVSSNDYMSPAEVQGLRVQDLIRGLNGTACQAFMDVLDVISRNVCFGHW